jgi:spore coat polysaccharide biosynthesis protein SpsF
MPGIMPVMRRAIVVQARMTSTRLPGKVLEDLAGKPALERQLERLQRCGHADEVVIATTVNADDDPVVALAERCGVRWFRGSELDVLSRYVGAAREARADMVVRVTSDCPLIDPVETDAVIAALEERRERADYASNFLERHLPRGLETEALWRDVLERADRMGTSAPSREHVTAFVHAERPDLFALHAVKRPYEAADLRWTVDTPEDLEVVRRIYAALGPEPRPLGEVIAWAREHPEVTALNAHVEQKRL